MFEERGINFRQAKGVEQQCPFVKIIEIGEKLAGEQSESEDRDFFCHLKAENIIYSSGHPQLVKNAILAPDRECNRITRTLMNQVSKIGIYLKDKDDKDIVDKEVLQTLSRWEKVISEHTDKDVWDFSQFEISEPSEQSKKTLHKVVMFTDIEMVRVSMGCKLVPQGYSINNQELT
jgi:hypothetical protein